MTHVFCAIYGPVGAFNLVAIFASREDCEAYIRRTTSEGSKVFAHLEDFRCIEQRVYGEASIVDASCISVENYSAAR